MRVVVVGGTGHIGTYLVPGLVKAGHEVVVLTRGKRQPYREDAAWTKVQTVVCDRAAEDKAGTFARRMRGYEAGAVIDLVCYKLESARALAEALRGTETHLLHCGTIWIYGPTEAAPTPEDFPRRPFGEYGIQKAAIEAYLSDETKAGRARATCVHPGHISGPGWPPINPAGHLDLAVWEKLAAGEELLLPDMGLGMLHHVHAEDVAGVFLAALAKPHASIGQSFHAVSPGALTLRGFAQAVAGWFGREAKLSYLPWDQWAARVSAKDAEITRDHVAHSPCAGMDRARRLLSFEPRHTSLATVREALAWLIANGKVKAPRLD